jgi:TonB family protein
MLEQLERPETRAQVTIPRLEIAPPVPVVEHDQRQRRRMVVALGLLLVALSLVLVKDRDFWFPAPDADVADNEAVEDTPTAPVSDAVASTPSVTSTTPAPVRRKREHAAPLAVSKPAAPAEPTAPTVSASRAALPPLRVDVIAGGDRRQVVEPGSPSVAVDLQPSQSARETTAAGSETARSAVVAAGEHVQMSSDTRQALTRPVRPEYPLLARQMKVQGAVLLSALIGKDGGIQNLQVLSGPAILADAAREAVRQWRFKPYFQNGQPVETQAKITVDFTIHAN